MPFLLGGFSSILFAPASFLQSFAFTILLSFSMFFFCIDVVEIWDAVSAFVKKNLIQQKVKC
jgi:hypothetical protein